MLVLSRKVDEVVFIGESIKVMVVEIRGETVRLGIEAPREVLVRRAELPADGFTGGKGHRGHQDR